MSVFPLALLLTLFACGRGSTPGTTKHSGLGPPRLHATVDLTIDGVDPRTDSVTFWNVQALTLDSAGRIFVADYSANRVFVYSPAGAYEFAIGRPGHGPGDLRDPSSIGFGPDGRLWVQEMGNQRFSAFDVRADGATFHSMLTLSVPVNRMANDRVSWDPSGRLVNVSTTYSRATNGFGLVRWLIDGSGDAVAGDTLHQPPPDSVGVALIRRGQGVTGVKQPFGPTQLWAFGPDGEEAEALSSRYDVRWYDSAHRLLRRIQRSVRGPEVSGAERQAADSILALMTKRLGVPRSAIPFGVPARKPPLAELGFDLDGRLWVRRSPRQGSPHEADVYDRDGQWVATMVWPGNVRLPDWAVRGRTGVGVARDSLRVERVVRLQFR